jgi:Fe-Mn family superoxide dismutase
VKKTNPPNPKGEQTMAYEQMPLPYAFDALEPYIDAQTMELHHGKHHATYVANTNKALEGHPDLAAKSIEALVTDLKSVPDSIATAIRNNAGAVVNHNMFWEIMAPASGQEPTDELAEALRSKFGGVDAFKEQFSKAGLGRFGSGWVWLILDGGGLSIVSTPNQDNPLSDGKTPILGLDVWEHAYYLKYQNRRPKYIEAWWNVVNWKEVARRFKEGRA